MYNFITLLVTAVMAAFVFNQGYKTGESKCLSQGYNYERTHGKDELTRGHPQTKV
jgi:hypothetical protein